MKLTKEQLIAFKEFCNIREKCVDFEDLELLQYLESIFYQCDIYLSNFKQYLNPHQYSLLLNNLWLHWLITSGQSQELYNKYDIGNKDMITSSVSSAGSSASIQPFASLENGEFLLLDLNRTPYGRLAYSILESIKNIAIVLL